MAATNFNTRNDTYRKLLGNGLTDIGNAEYETKRAAYQRSVYQTTRELGEQYGEWTPERLGARQADMAAAAATVWRVGQLE